MRGYDRHFDKEIYCKCAMECVGTGSQGHKNLGTTRGARTINCFTGNVESTVICESLVHNPFSCGLLRYKHTWTCPIFNFAKAIAVDAMRTVPIQNRFSASFYPMRFRQNYEDSAQNTVQWKHVQLKF